MNDPVLAWKLFQSPCRLSLAPGLILSGMKFLDDPKGLGVSQSPEWSSLNLDFLVITEIPLVQ